MKIDKAIEILKDTRNITFNYFSPDRKDALKLGIEALKQLQELHNRPHGSPLPPLPGETPEEEVKS